MPLWEHNEKVHQDLILIVLNAKISFLLCFECNQEYFCSSQILQKSEFCYRANKLHKICLVLVRCLRLLIRWQDLFHKASIWPHYELNILHLPTSTKEVHMTSFFWHSMRVLLLLNWICQVHHLQENQLLIEVPLPKVGTLQLLNP